MAVAFIGRDWSDILRGFVGPMRVVCWLSSTNTNPYAVEALMRRRHAGVRQLDAMHAKVYLPRCRPRVAIVGSANLSTSALSDEDAAGQYEAAVLVKQPPIVRDASSWFETLWRSAERITQHDLHLAQAQWERARAKMSGGRGGGRKKPPPTLPAGWNPTAELRRLAAKVRGAPLLQHHGQVLERRRFLRALAPERITRAQLRHLISLVAGWTGHIGAYRPTLLLPLGVVRRTFAFAFDQSVPVVERLQDLADGGGHKVPGFGVNAWALVLYWYDYTTCLPFNARTKKFLRDFRLARPVPKTFSATAYRNWHSLALDLQQRLRLPTIGHVELMVWEHSLR
jgi:hypothetical protein